MFPDHRLFFFASFFDCETDIAVNFTGQAFHRTLRAHSSEPHPFPPFVILCILIVPGSEFRVFYPDGMFKGIYNGKQCHVPDIATVLNRAWSAGVERIIVSTSLRI